MDVLVLNARRGIRAGEINIPQLLDDLHEARVLLEDIQNDVGQASREADTAETFVAVPVKTVPTPPRFETGVHVDPDGTAQPYARCVSGHKPVDPEAERLAATDYSTGTVTMSTADEAAVDVDGRAIWEDHFPRERSRPTAQAPTVTPGSPATTTGSTPGPGPTYRPTSTSRLGGRVGEPAFSLGRPFASPRRPRRTPGTRPWGLPPSRPTPSPRAPCPSTPGKRREPGVQATTTGA